MIVKNNIIVNQTPLIMTLLGNGTVDWDEIINLYPKYNGKDSEGECDNCTELCDSIDKRTHYCPDCFEENNFAHEIYEWWAVSEWLADKLQAHNEPILRNSLGTWWGRTSTGQEVIDDAVIITIAYEYEIEMDTKIL